MTASIGLAFQARCLFAHALWYVYGGMAGNPDAVAKGGLPPDPDSWIYQAYQLYDLATTARAKGVLLLKYPVRLALNPFVSGIGAIFPQLVSGGAIVAIVLGLPTVGPLMLNALMTEDMFLAGSMLMVLSLLGIFGMLVSDLLLLWLDPRIRFEK